MTIRRRLIDTFLILCILVFLAWGFAGAIGIATDIMYRAATGGRVVNIGEVQAAEHMAMQWRRLHTGYSIAIVLVTALAGWFLTRRIIGGCSALQKGADEFAAGNLSYRVTWPKQDEFGQLATHFNQMAKKLFEAQEEIKRQQELAESLLLNMLPREIAEELRQKGTVQPRYHEDVTILFTDFKGFTAATERIPAAELVSMLHDYFTAFDAVTTRYGLEKLKTIGDSYMCVAGLPQRIPSHAVDAVLAGFAIIEEVLKRSTAGAGWSVRVGVHTGPVVSGVVGVRKFAFDVWGESVNLASRLESCGSSNRVNLSTTTYARVKDFFSCEARGPIQTKEGRSYEMYFAEGIAATLRSNPEAFARQYTTYFQREFAGLPEILLQGSTAKSATTIERVSG